MLGKRKDKKSPKVLTGPVRRPPAPPSTPPVRSTGAAKGTMEVTADSYQARLSPEERAKREVEDKMMEDVRKFFEKDPEAASQLLRVWLTAAKKQKT